MAINVSLINFTEQGMKNIKESPKRVQRFATSPGSMACRCGRSCGPSGSTTWWSSPRARRRGLTAGLISVAKLGNVRSQTLRAMDQETFQRVLEKVD